MAKLKSRVKEYREAAGMKQCELAQRIGVCRESIVHLEGGRYNPSLKMAMDIAAVFAVPVEQLFSFEEEEQ